MPKYIMVTIFHNIKTFSRNIQSRLQIDSDSVSVVHAAGGSTWTSTVLPLRCGGLRVNPPTHVVVYILVCLGVSYVVSGSRPLVGLWVDYINCISGIKAIVQGDRATKGLLCSVCYSLHKNHHNNFRV